MSDTWDRLVAGKTPLIAQMTAVVVDIQAIIIGGSLPTSNRSRIITSNRGNNMAKNKWTPQQEWERINKFLNEQANKCSFR